MYIVTISSYVTNTYEPHRPRDSMLPKTLVDNTQRLTQLYRVRPKGEIM